MTKKLFTSESVTEGHPDKLCDQISDAVLDDIISKDPNAHVACEVAVTTGLVLVMGEITTDCYADIAKITRQVICDAGYDNAAQMFDGNTCSVLTAIDEQSPDIAMGVNNALENRESSNSRYDAQGAGDQGLMFGFACDETSELMPLPISLSHKLAKRLTELRKSGELPWLRPDGKTQVTVEYDGFKPIRVETVVVSAQHAEDVTLDEIRREIIEKVIHPIIPDDLMDNDTNIFVNPTGRFVIGGPHGDSGLTGRKIIVDTYGGYARHGGGAFSGKDPSKVDRSAAYMARYAAKNIVAAGLASQCELQLAYAIGVARPVSVMVDTFGTGKIADKKIAAIAEKVFDFRPAAIIEKLKLARPIYRQLAAYGHVGREDLDVEWEKIDMVEKLKEYSETI